jgi:hypothetical protein
LLFKPSKRARKLVVVDETVLKVNVMMVEVVQEMKDRTKRFHNNVNSKKLKSIEEIATAVAIVHNHVRIEGGG